MGSYLRLEKRASDSKLLQDEMLAQNQLKHQQTERAHQTNRAQQRTIDLQTKQMDAQAHQIKKISAAAAASGTPGTAGRASTRNITAEQQLKASLESTFRQLHAVQTEKTREIQKHQQRESDLKKKHQQHEFESKKRARILVLQLQQLAISMFVSGVAAAARMKTITKRTTPNAHHQKQGFNTSHQ
jgi:hypothetical protein